MLGGGSHRTLPACVVWTSKLNCNGGEVGGRVCIVVGVWSNSRNNPHVQHTHTHTLHITYTHRITSKDKHWLKMFIYFSALAFPCGGGKIVSCGVARGLRCYSKHATQPSTQHTCTQHTHHSFITYPWFDDVYIFFRFGFPLYFFSACGFPCGGGKIVGCCVGLRRYNKRATQPIT